jgi:hypothetical protein
VYSEWFRIIGKNVIMWWLSMALPCVCFKCARYLTRKSLKDFYSLGIEELDICADRVCDECEFQCEHFVAEMTNIMLADYWD